MNSADQTSLFNKIDYIFGFIIICAFHGAAAMSFTLRALSAKTTPFNWAAIALYVAIIALVSFNPAFQKVFPYRLATLVKAVSITVFACVLLAFLVPL